MQKRHSYLMEPTLTEAQTGYSLPPGISMGDDGIPRYDDDSQVVPIVRRPNVLPVTRGPQGETIWAIPKALDIIGAMLPATKISQAPKSLAFRTGSMYDPPVMPQRPIAADYPIGVQADATGRISKSIEGLPLVARHIVGRSAIDGGDVALATEALEQIAQAGTGSGISRVPQNALSGDLGRVSVNPSSRQPTGVAVASGSSPRVASHEIGHVIDQVAGEISSKGLGGELSKIYNSLNNGMRNAAGTDARASAPSFSPKHAGYKGSDVEREYMAEAIRAYMTNPNYLKTVAPETATRMCNSTQEFQ